MQDRSGQQVLVKFGVFELDPHTGELRKAGARVRLAGQPVRLLERLLDRPGALVTREELRQELWSNDTFVDFERNLNSAIKRLRTALGDSADSPRFIETLPRRGYRFLVPVERIPLHPPAADTPVVVASPNRPRRVRWLGAVALLMLIVAGALGYTAWRDRTHAFRAIAVLPFVLANPASTEDEYLAFGLSEALITELSKRGHLRVISQTSSMQYKNAAKALPTIAEELDVDVVVEGSVQREGDRVRITVQLIEAGTDTHLWAENYERDVGGVLTLVDEVARAVVEQIHVEITSSRATRERAPRAVDSRVTDAYLKGRFHLGKGTETDYLRAASYFEQALALDSAHALSHSGLANYYAVSDVLAPERAIPKAKLHAAKALELDETLPEAHASLAYVRFYYDWDWAGAEQAFKRAIELDPGYAGAHRWYGLFLSAMGRHAAALDQTQIALEADPISVVNHDAAAMVRFNARQFAETVGIGREIHDLNAFDTRAYEHMAAGLIQQRRPAEALVQADTGLQLAKSNLALEIIRVICLGRLARTMEADRALAAFEQQAQDQHVPSVVLAMAHAELGRHAQALTRLEQAFDERDPYLVLLNVSPWFDSIRTDQRFERLLDRLNFPD